jgi:hypothetical protein
MEPGIHVDPPLAVVQDLVDDVVSSRSGLMMVRLRGVRTERQLAAAMVRGTRGHRTADAMLPSPPRRWRSALLFAHIDGADSPRIVRRFSWGLPALIDGWRIQGVDLAVVIEARDVRDVVVASIEGGRRELAVRAALPWTPGSWTVTVVDDDPMRPIAPAPTPSSGIGLRPRLAADRTPRLRWTMRGRSLRRSRAGVHVSGQGGR